MAETMNGLKRTSYCGRLSKANVGKEEIVCGWVQKQRDKGHLIFIDLRDRTGVVQLVFDDDTNREVFEKAASVHSEYVLIARGLVRQREAVNTEISTGEIEIHVEELRILSKAQTPPFEITDKSKVKEELRLKYRYLDLRRKPLQEKMILRHQIAKVTRDYFYENDFLEIETPMLIKSTPEGARDYLVPSRIHHGKFYALPQSPQIYKQLLMLSGFDRYIQLARCPGRPGDVLCHPGGHHGHAGGLHEAAVQGGQGHRYPQNAKADLPRGDGALRFGQAGHPLWHGAD